MYSKLEFVVLLKLKLSRNRLENQTTTTKTTMSLIKVNHMGRVLLSIIFNMKIPRPYVNHTIKQALKHSRQFRKQI